MNNIQFGFDFFPDSTVAPVASAPPSKRSKVKALVMDASSMALELEKHPDYRVLRRLQPVLRYAPAPSGALVQRIVVLDTETTGLDHGKDKIIELALLRVDVNMATGLPVGEVQVYDGLEDPGCPIPPEVVELTGIRDADVAGQKLDEARIAQLLEGADWVIAHNAGFDRPFCEARLPECAALHWACSFADLDWKAQGRSSAKLEMLALAEGWFYDAHRAEMDCHALLAVLTKPLPKATQTGLAQLLQNASQTSYRLQATSAPFDAKDKLKARGYRWNAEQRVWHTNLANEAALQLECEWLKAHAYSHRSATLQMEKLHAAIRYSARPGELMQRSV